MSVSHFDWPAAWRWAASLEAVPAGPCSQQVQAILDTASGTAPREWQTPAVPPTAPLRLSDWLHLTPGALLQEVRLRLSETPQDPGEYAAVVLPGCAFAACRAADLPLAAALLELMVHWNLKLLAAGELADYLAFQQRPEGSCGYLNPLRPTPFAPGEALMAYHLPVTHAITGALSAYAHWRGHSPVEVST